MSTPAQRRFDRVRAARVSAAAEPGEPLNGATAYELMLAKLDTDRRRLREIQSIERKVDVKREVLPEYDDWVRGALESGRGAQDDVLTTVMIWHIDAGNVARALDIAAYVLEHGLTLPDQYERSVATALVDEISGAALAALRNGTEFDPVLLSRLAALTAEHDMPDPARAKLHKALGLHLKASGELADARSHLQRALELHDGAGCKRDLAEVERQLNKGATP